MSRETIHCDYYRAAALHETCKVGIVYETFRGTSGGIASWPCFWHQSLPQPCSCPSAQYPTPEEIAAEDAEFEERFRKIALAREAIVKACGGPWTRKNPTGGRGAIDCPACGGVNTLCFTRAGYNGHIHAQCATDGCVSWME